MTNVVRHAYDQRGDASVDVTVQHERNEVTVTVRDRGRGLTAGRPSDTGGYGLEIIDELTTRHVIRTSPGDGTELAMVFELCRPTQVRSVARVRRAAARA